MSHQALIQALCADLTPVKPQPAETPLARGVLAGSSISLAILLVTLGIQPDTGRPDILFALLLKAGTMTALAWFCFRSLAALARPGADNPSLVAPAGRILAAVALIGLAQLTLADSPQLQHPWLGASWQSCSLRIGLLSMPILAAMFWRMRERAPVDLPRTGAVAGLCAGSSAAALYALACSEQSAGFVLLWYSLGIGASGIAGMLAAPRLLRW
jgi:hypothetical protein